MQGVQNVFRSLGLAVVGTMHPRMLWLSFRPFLIVSILWGGDALCPPRPSQGNEIRFALLALAYFRFR